MEVDYGGAVERGSNMLCNAVIRLVIKQLCHLYIYCLPSDIPTHEREIYTCRGYCPIKCSYQVNLTDPQCFETASQFNLGLMQAPRATGEMPASKN